MSLAKWLIRVLTHGESVQRDPLPDELSGAERAAVLAVLESAFRDHVADVAGPRIAFDAETALGAALTLAECCWQVAARPSEGTGPPTDFLREPTSAAAHLSADLTLRFLPAVLQRSRANAGAKPLSDRVEALLRRWPLSGVLADLAVQPAVPLHFEEHGGLQLFYAERLVTRPRAGWVPKDGPAREWVERVFHQYQKPIPVDVPTQREGAA